MTESQICIYKSPFLSVLNLFCFEFCSFDFSPTAFMTSEHKHQHLLGQYMDSHRIFLQNMISVLLSLFSSCFLPQDIRRYSYHRVYWILLLFAVLLSFSGISSRTYFLVKSHERVHFLPQFLFLFPSSLHVFFRTYFTSAFIPLGQIPKKRLVMFSTFFLISFYDSPILL